MLAASIACGGGTSGSPTRSGSPPGTTPTAASPSPGLSFDWPEYHQNPARTGAGPASPALTNPREAWRVALDGDIYASPLIVSGDRKSTRLNSSHSSISYAV